MNKILQFTLLLMLIASVSTISAQNRRYVDPVFDDVEVSDIQVAGENYTILPWIFAFVQKKEGHTVAQPLVFQTYTPKEDSNTKRPLVIYLHTGNFLPFPQNGSCGGTIADNSNIEIATRLAKMGYVVASCDYRLGWLPTHPEELTRRFSLINGAYRGVQDVNTFIRYFKKSVKDEGNPYGIDPDKIVVWGQGTGGYLSLAASTLKSYDEIFKAADKTKWVVPVPGVGNVPMVQEKYNGNVYGTSDVTVVDALYSGVTKIPVGDTLSVPNHVTYANGDTIASNFQLAVNMGGALGDSTWIDESDIPIVSYHVPSDPFAPYETDVLQVPTASGPQPVVEVSGSYDVSRIANFIGLNDVFLSIELENDPIGRAKDDAISLCHFPNTPDDTSSPWEWTDLSNPKLIAKDCNGDADQAKTYIDSIIGFYAPRGCVALGLNCYTTSVEDVQLDGSYLTVAPNPVQDFIHVSSDKADIKSVAVYSVDGKVIDQRNDVNRRNLTIERNNMPDGIYFVKVRFEEGVRTQKVMFN